MADYRANLLELARRPSALVPVAMSLSALAVVVVTVLSVGVRRQPDEGTAAHIFQLLIAGQAPIVLFFVLRWSRRDAKAVLTVLAMQVVAIGLALFTVWRLGL